MSFFLFLWRRLKSSVHDRYLSSFLVLTDFPSDSDTAFFETEGPSWRVCIVGQMISNLNRLSVCVTTHTHSLSHIDSNGQMLVKSLSSFSHSLTHTHDEDEDDDDECKAYLHAWRHELCTKGCK